MTLSPSLNHWHWGWAGDWKKIKFNDLDLSPIKNNKLVQELSFELRPIESDNTVRYKCLNYNFAEVTITETNTLIIFDSLKVWGIYSLYIKNLWDYVINFWANGNDWQTYEIYGVEWNKPEVSTTGEYILTVFCSKWKAHFFLQWPMAIFTN
jgi:hypothetical protein